MAGVSPYTLYFFESDAVRNQNWVPTVANIVIGNFTNGEDYISMDYPLEKAKQGYSGLKITDLANATSFIIKKGKRGYFVDVRSRLYTKATMDYVDEFFLRNEHVKAVNYKDIYMVIVAAATVYEKFTDNSGTRRDYLQCALFTPVRTKERNQMGKSSWDVSFTIKSAFR